MEVGSSLIISDSYIDWFNIGKSGKGELCCYARGYASVGCEYYEGKNLAEYIYTICSQKEQSAALSDIRKNIPLLKGEWALALQWPNGYVLAAADRMRTIPLFYAIKNNSFLLASDIEEIQKKFNFYEINEESELELLLCGYITGKETVFKNICKIQSGEIIEYDPALGSPNIEVNRYYRFFPTGYSFDSEFQLENELVNVLDTIFNRFLSRYKKGRVIVPLSGGLDSRLVAAMLKRHGVDDALCFTYGAPQWKEVQISQQVAKALGYEWCFIAYSRNMWAESMKSPEMKDYLAYACKGTSLPHLQDFPAVIHIMDHYPHVTNPLFFPGHSADMLAGSHIPQNYNALQSFDVSVEDMILLRHYNLKYNENYLSMDFIKEKVMRTVFIDEWKSNPVACFEMWDAENRQSLYIVNSVRVYEFVGARWRTLWDYDLMDFFLKVPTHYRYQKKLYVNTLYNHIFIDKAESLKKISVHKVKRKANMKTSKYKIAVKHVLDTLSILKTIKKVKGRFEPRYEHPMLFESWFSNGRDPKTITVEEAVQTYITVNQFSDAVLRLVKPILNNRLDRTSVNRVLSLIILGELYKSNTK